MRIDIAGVQVDNITVSETLQKIKDFVRSGQPHYVVTTYSEFVVEGQRNEKYRQVLNNADLSVPDGIGILWAAKYLSEGGKNIFSWLISLASIVFAPNSLRTVIKEQVTGRELVWDISRLAVDQGFSLALVGGEDSIAAQAAYELKKRFPGLKINLAVSGGYPFDEKTVREISQSNSDILLIAYQAPKQEIWIAENLQNLNVKVAIGLGGTFDYLAGKRPVAPKIMHKMGFEWLWRLITQPWRLKRIWKAVVGFSWIVFKYKRRHG